MSLPGERIGLAGDLAQSPPSIHVSKRLLFSIVHEKSGGRQTLHNYHSVWPNKGLGFFSGALWGLKQCLMETG